MEGRGGKNNHKARGTWHLKTFIGFYGFEAGAAESKETEMLRAYMRVSGKAAWVKFLISRWRWMLLMFSSPMQMLCLHSFKVTTFCPKCKTAHAPSPSAIEVT